jgi:GH24 family phage-related lysozyme (muramidase)
MTAISDDLDQHVEAQLAVEEGNRALMYDDATGKTFVKGDTLQGNLTIGEGINLMPGLAPEELAFIEKNRIDKVRALVGFYPWYNTQDEVRQAGLCDLGYNLGLRGLLGWPKFLAYMALKDYPSAVAEMQSNIIWVGQVHPARANRIEQMFLSGQWPKDIAVGAIAT